MDTIRDVLLKPAELEMYYRPVPSQGSNLTTVFGDNLQPKLQLSEKEIELTKVLRRVPYHILSGKPEDVFKSMKKHYGKHLRECERAQETLGAEKFELVLNLVQNEKAASVGAELFLSNLTHLKSVVREHNEIREALKLTATLDEENGLARNFIKCVLQKGEIDIATNANLCNFLNELPCGRDLRTFESAIVKVIEEQLRNLIAGSDKAVLAFCDKNPLHGPSLLQYMTSSEDDQTYEQAEYIRLTRNASRHFLATPAAMLLAPVLNKQASECAKTVFPYLLVASFQAVYNLNHRTIWLRFCHSTVLILCHLGRIPHILGVGMDRVFKESLKLSHCLFPAMFDEECEHGIDEIMRQSLANLNNVKTRAWSFASVKRPWLASHIPVTFSANSLFGTAICDRYPLSSLSDSLLYIKWAGATLEDLESLGKNADVQDMGEGDRLKSYFFENLYNPSTPQMCDALERISLTNAAINLKGIYPNCIREIDLEPQATEDWENWS